VTRRPGKRDKEGKNGKEQFESLREDNSLFHEAAEEGKKNKSNEFEGGGKSYEGGGPGRQKQNTKTAQGNHSPP